LKTCTKCKIEKPEGEFGKRKEGKGGLMSQCRSCKADHRAANRDRINENNSRWEDRNKEAVSQRHHIRYLNETPEKRESRRERQRRRQKLGLDRETDRAYNNFYYASKYNINIIHTLRVKLRNRLYQCIKTEQKIGSAVRDLGCSVPAFKNYIEGIFEVGMTWENWGNQSDQWSLDHIMPLSAFNLTDPQHVLLACHYLNLRPMWHIENIKKSNKIPMEILNATAD